MKNYLFTLLMCLSIVTALPAVWNKLIFSKLPLFSHTQDLLYTKSEDASDSSFDYDMETISAQITPVSPNVTETFIDETAETVTETEIETETQVSEPTDLPEEKSFSTVSTDYWSDALFIGDSRTMGLYEYADLGNADVFANSGMNVYKVFSEKLSVSGSTKYTLEELLTQNVYGKVYVMLGINELGYNLNQSVEKYKELIDAIQQQQPDALLFLQANLHVTQKQSDSDPIFNNTAINQINSEIAKFADNKTLFYIDANELFDDEQGNLSTEFAGDAAHIFGKYYAQWAEWLLTKGIE